MFGLNNILFTHRNHKLNKQVQETQKQYAYFSVTYIQNDNHTDTYDGTQTPTTYLHFDLTNSQSLLYYKHK